MGFDRELLPDARSYYENQPIRLKPISGDRWSDADCIFHRGRALRVHLRTGAFVCMNCGVKGGDVLSYQVQAYRQEFVEAVKALGAWKDDGKPMPVQQPLPGGLSARQALTALSFEALIVAGEGSRIAQGLPISEQDRARVWVAARRIDKIARGYQ